MGPVWRFVNPVGGSHQGHSSQGKGLALRVAQRFADGQGGRFVGEAR